MTNISIGDRVEVLHYGQYAGVGEVVEHISPGYVGVRYDTARSGVNVWGQMYTFTHACCHVETLRHIDQPDLFKGETLEAYSRPGCEQAIANPRSTSEQGAGVSGSPDGA